MLWSRAVDDYYFFHARIMAVESVDGSAGKGSVALADEGPQEPALIGWLLAAQIELVLLPTFVYKHRILWPRPHSTCLVKGPKGFVSITGEAAMAALVPSLHLL